MKLEQNLKHKSSIYASAYFKRISFHQRCSCENILNFKSYDKWTQLVTLIGLHVFDMT